MHLSCYKNHIYFTIIMERSDFLLGTQEGTRDAGIGTRDPKGTRNPGLGTEWHGERWTTMKLLDILTSKNGAGIA